MPKWLAIYMNLSKLRSLINQVKFNTVNSYTLTDEEENLKKKYVTIARYNKDKIKNFVGEKKLMLF